MTYTAFRKEVFRLGLTVAQLRCDEPPIDSVNDLIDSFGQNQRGLDRYESFVIRFQNETEPVSCVS